MGYNLAWDGDSVGLMCSLPMVSSAVYGWSAYPEDTVFKTLPSPVPSGRGTWSAGCNLLVSETAIKGSNRSILGSGGVADTTHIQEGWLVNCDCWAPERKLERSEGEDRESVSLWVCVCVRKWETERKREREREGEGEKRKRPRKRETEKERGRTCQITSPGHVSPINNWDRVRKNTICRLTWLTGLATV